MQRAQATPTVQIDNENVKVTEWRFPPNSETGWHEHTMDYVVVPMTTGNLTLETDQGTIESALTTGLSYAKKTGIRHNVVNANNFEFVFVEIEVKN